ncbi:hypothetical protein PV350_19510 [Streptomyces sp. PA03-6a]|nr:hypothetical protein [Streptomyces sp. PA03-6a]
MTAKDINTRHAPATAGRLPRPTARREDRASRQQERSRQSKPMNAPWPNAKTHRLFQVPERRCSQGRQLGLHPAQTPPHTPLAGQPAQVAMQVTGGEVCLATSPPAVRLPAVAAATGDEFARKAWLDDAVGISRWHGRRTPVTPPCPVHREASSPAPAHETAGAGTDAGLPGHLLRIAFCDDECQPSVDAEPEGEILAPLANGQPCLTLPRAAAEALRAPAERRGHARGSTTRCAADAPVPTTASHEQAARIAETGTKADTFEGAV